MSSLSSVVSDLLRASMGSTVPNTVTDDDLDRHIGEIILREAKQKAERYKKEGIHAYLPAASDPNVPRTNKRFLSSIIKSTDDHNKAVMRSQAVAAAELKEEREAQARRERRARADEAAQDRLRRLMSGGRRRRGISEDRWQPDRDGRSRKRRERSWERGEDGSDWAARSRSRSPAERKRYWDEDEDEYRARTRASRRREDDTLDDGRRRQRRRCHRSSSHKEKEKSVRRSPSPESGGDSVSSRGRGHPHLGGSASRSHSRQGDKCKPSSTRNKPSGGDLTPTHHHRRRRSRRQASSSRSRSPQRDKPKSRSHPSHTSAATSESSRQPSAVSRSPSPHWDKAKSKAPMTATSSAAPVPAQMTTSCPTSSRSSSPELLSRSPSPAPMPSKMDKYFSSSYDPRLDVAPLASSSTLTIDVPATGLVNNAQFEGWDAMLELIRVRREDRAERKRLERLGLLPDKDAKGGRGKKGQGMASAALDDSKGIMEIEYKKKGAVREWDMGKEGF